MSKYLSEFGWRLIIFTPSNAEMPVVDTSLVRDVADQHQILNHPIWEPYSWYKLLTGRKSGDTVYSGFISENGRQSVMEKISIWLRGNLFVPDPRKFWVRPSVHYLRQYLATNPVDAIISTGPPHSVHLIANQLAASIGMPWIADFRDPWTGIDYYPELKLTAYANWKHHRLEKQVLTSADRVVTVSPSWASDLGLISGRSIKVIYNGFDPDDYSTQAPALDQLFTINHFGSMNRDRNPRALWQALAILRQQGHPLIESLRVNLIGSVDYEVTRVVHQLGLEDLVSIQDHIAHDRAIKRMRSSQLLLLAINRTENARGVIPGKFFEYLGTERPILLLGPPNGDAAKILIQANSGRVADFDDTDTLVDALTDFYRAYLEGRLALVSRGFSEYSRRELAGQYCQLLDKLIDC